MRRPLRPVVAALLSVPALLALPLAASAQTVGMYSVLRADTSPRAAALAGAADAIPSDDPGVLFANPALLDGSQAGALALTYVNHVGDVSSGSLAYARRVAGFDAAVGVRYHGFGTLRGADNAGVETGDFGAGVLALSAGTSYPLSERLRVGGTVTVATSYIDDARGTALSADLGAALRLPGELTVSANARHVGTAVARLGSETDALPLDLRVGVSKRLRYLPLRLTAVGHTLQKPGAGLEGRSTFEQVLGHLSIGGELLLGRAVQIRAGFAPRTNQELSTAERLDLAGAGVGVGLRVRQFAFDYGLVSWSGNGALHHVGVRARL